MSLAGSLDPVWEDSPFQSAFQSAFRSSKVWVELVSPGRRASALSCPRREDVGADVMIVMSSQQCNGRNASRIILYDTIWIILNDILDDNYKYMIYEWFILWLRSCCMQPALFFFKQEGLSAGASYLSAELVHARPHFALSSKETFEPNQMIVLDDATWWYLSYVCNTSDDLDLE